MSTGQSGAQPLSWPIVRFRVASRRASIPQRPMIVSWSVPLATIGCAGAGGLASTGIGVGSPATGGGGAGVSGLGGMGVGSGAWAAAEPTKVNTVNAIANPRSLLGVLDMKEILSFKKGRDLAVRRGG